VLIEGIQQVAGLFTCSLAATNSFRLQDRKFVAVLRLGELRPDQKLLRYYGGAAVTRARKTFLQIHASYASLSLDATNMAPETRSSEIARFRPLTRHKRSRTSAQKQLFVGVNCLWGHATNSAGHGRDGFGRLLGCLVNIINHMRAAVLAVALELRGSAIGRRYSGRPIMSRARWAIPPDVAVAVFVFPRRRCCECDR